ncbi:alpha/beta hydrolase fold domain-containing protein [Actinocorallia longicatena]|uniref:alpha/beta hydrolase fold domain-containing protein n=1 Tax=Actinocorallia longicatena TaxID=111803 RepID=UPI0031D0B39E
MTTELRVDAHSLGLSIRPPTRSGGVVLYLTGDRDLASDPEGALDRAGHLAIRTGCIVVCARYRSAFPEALDDVRRAYDLCERADPIVVAGERGGAGLATALLVRLRDEGAVQPHRAILVSPMLDFTLEAPSLSFNAAADPGFSLAHLRQRVSEYAGGTPLTDPLLSPLFANLHGLPPIQMQTAGTDPHLDDALSFAARAARSGVTVDLHVRPDTAALHAALLPTMAAFLTG